MNMVKIEEIARKEGWWHRGLGTRAQSIIADYQGVEPFCKTIETEQTLPLLQSKLRSITPRPIKLDPMPKQESGKPAGCFVTRHPLKTDLNLTKPRGYFQGVDHFVSPGIGQA